MPIASGGAAGIGGVMAGARQYENLFDQAYHAGVPDEVAAPAAPALAGRELAAGVAPAEPIALRGCVLTPDGPVEDGFVVVGAATGSRRSRANRPRARVSTGRTG